MKTERDVALMIDDIIWDAQEKGEAPDVRKLESFASAGIMTSNAGIVITMTDGTEFQVTVVHSK